MESTKDLIAHLIEYEKRKGHPAGWLSITQKLAVQLLLKDGDLIKGVPVLVHGSRPMPEAA